MDSDTGQQNFPEVLRIRAPRGLQAALTLAAKQRFTTASEWSRQALIAALEDAGIRLATDQPEKGAR